MKVNVTYAKYRNPSLEIHHGNPLICALPEKVEPSRLRKVLTYIPRLPPTKSMSKDDRIHTAKQLRNVVVPTVPFLDAYNHIYEMIVTGYEARNPLDPKVVEWSYDIANPEVGIEALREKHQSTVEGENTTSEHLFLTGLSGIGKSRIKTALMGTLFPNVIIHTKEGFDDLQIVYLNVEMPHDGSRATLLRNLFKALDDSLKGVADTQYLEEMCPTGKRAVSIGSMEDRFQFLCVKYHVGVIIIDEFQHLNVASRRYFDEMLQLFDSLSNTLHVPMVRIGTPESLKYFTKYFRHARRAGHAIELLPYPNPGSSDGTRSGTDRGTSDWQRMIDVLFQFQVLNTPTPRSDRLEQELYKLSCGLPYCLFTLWQEAQVEAIRSGSERITLKLLNAVYNDRFKLIKIALSALRRKNPQHFQDLLTINQLVYKGENEAAIKHLHNFTENENFTGTAAVELAEAVDDLEFESLLSPEQKAKMAKIKQTLKLRSQSIQKGQTLEHDKA